MIRDTIIPYIKFEYCNEFGNITKFESTLDGVTINDMLDIYKRFLNGCGFYVKGDIVESELMS